MSTLTLKEKGVVEDVVAVKFKIAGLPEFELEMELSTAIREVKKLAKELCNIEPEHMRILYKDTELKASDTLDNYEVDSDVPVKILYTAGHTALDGGSVNFRQLRNPYLLPVRGMSGSKGQRSSRVSGRRGGMGLIRKYGIMMKRQEFREKAPEIGFHKYS